VGVATEMMIDARSRTVWVDYGAEASFVPGGRELRGCVSAPTYSGDGSEVRVLVEVHRAHGGMLPRTMLGGVFNGSPGTSLTLLLRVDNDDESDLSVDVPSRRGRPLVRGIPAECAEATLHKLLTALSATGIPSGTFIVDQAAHDVLDYSEVAFRRTAEVLVVALAARLTDADAEKSIGELLEMW
jgi:hypothetical protein